MSVLHIWLFIVLSINSTTPAILLAKDYDECLKWSMEYQENGKIGICVQGEKVISYEKVIGK